MANVKHLVKRIDVEMSGGSRWYMATAMQGDRATRYISARLLDEGEKYTIPDDVDVNVSIKKPDGHSLLYACVVSEEGRVIFELTRQALAVVGVLRCNIEISSKDMQEVIRSCTFEIEVESTTRDDDEIVSSNEYTALERKIKEANDLIELFKVQIARLNSVISAGSSSDTTCPETVQIRTDIDGETWETAAGRVDALQNEARTAKAELQSAISALNTAMNSTAAAQDTQITQLRQTIEGIAGEMSETFTDIEAMIEEMNGSLTQQLNETKVDDVSYNAETYMLHLTRDGNEIGAGTEIIAGSGGGGGGGGSSSIVTVRNLMGSSAINIPFGSDLDLRFAFTSTLDGVETGAGQAKLYVNNALKGTYTANQGENTILAVGRFLKEGTNSLRLIVADEYGSSRSLNITVTAVSIELRSSFNDGQIFTGAATIKFTPIGAIEKTTIVYIDGKEYHTETTTASRQQSTLEIPFISHGVHPVEIWTEAELNGTKIESKHLHFNLCFAEEGNQTPFVALRADSDTVSQGDLMTLYFLAYDPANPRIQVQQIIENEDGTQYSAAVLTVDRVRQVWTTKRYPVGAVKFKIVYNKATAAEIPVTVTEPDINVQAVTNDLEVYLFAEGRDNSETNKDAWTDGEISTAFSGMNWVTNGWMSDDNGDKRLKVTGGGRAVVGFNPFGDDLRRHGKTLEIEFMVHDVNTAEHAVISCMEESTGIGIEITGDTARMCSEMSSVECNFRYDKKVCIAFVVESTSEYRLMSIYLNGHLTQMIQYPETDNFCQANPLPLTIGSATCGVSIYKIRSYSTALTAREVVNNYIADTQDIGKKLDLYDRNNIYDEYNNIMYSSVVKKIPCITIIGELPTFKGDKKNDVFKYENIEFPVLDFEKTGKNDVQGTSSQWFVRKNFKGKFTDEVLLAVGTIATKTICLKADYAEATSTHNTQNAMFVETLYSDKSPAQQIDSRCRRTIFGYPVVVFHQATESDTPEFVGKYNFNYDKNSDEGYGFNMFPNVQRWEVCNNTSDQCNFKSDNLSVNPEEHFEIQYPDTDEPDYSAIQGLLSWVVSTNQEAATGASLAASYTGIDGTVYESDTAEYRLAKFKKEFEQHFNLHASLIYYVYTFFALMVDQRAKNMHLVTWDCTANPCIFEPWFYDNDTSFGINNEGEKRFKYWHEDTDQLEGANVYNGQNSVLWVNFRMAFADKIAETYQSLRTSKKLTEEKLVAQFVENGSRKWPANIYNDDAEYKYISMVRTENDTSNLPQIKGSGEDDHEFMFNRRLMYCDSKFHAGDFVDDTVSLRIYTPEQWAGVEPKADVTLTSASDMYQAVRYKANGALQKKRVKAGVPTLHVAPVETFNDTEFGIYGASELSSLGDLSPLYCGSVKVGKATRLLELIVGSAVEGYSNNNLTELTVGANTMLQRLNIMNCPRLRQNIDLSGCTGIEEIYAQGSGITGVTLPEGGYLRVMKLPGTVTNLTVKNQNYIETFEIDGYNNLTTLWVENSNGLPVLSIIKNASRLTRLRVTGVDWNFTTADTLMSFREIGGIDENGYNTTVAVIAGQAHIETLKASEKNDLARAFPELDVTCDTFIEQYRVTFKNEDGTLLDTQFVDRGGAAVDPIAREILPIDVPTKPSTIDQTFTFNTWNKLLSPILEDTEITATFVPHVRQYTVSFYAMNEFICSDTVDVYTAASFTGETPKRAETPGSYLYYLFTGWDKDFDNVTSDLRVNAVFAECGVPLRKVELQPGQKLTDVYTVNEIYAICRSDLFKNYLDPLDEIEIPMNSTAITDTSIVLQVFGFNHFRKSDGSELSHVVFGMKGTLTAPRRLNATNTNVGGWPATEMQTWLNGRIFESLPQIWKSMIEEVIVRSSEGNQSPSIVESHDKLFLFSNAELGWNTADVPYKNEVDAEAETIKFPVFTDTNSRIKKTYNGEGSAVSWWLRSPEPSHGTGFRAVNSYGNAANHYATIANSVCFGFCVG